MHKCRVFLEAVRDPADPSLIKRLIKLSRRDEQAVVALLSDLPAVLADGVDQAAAERLSEYLESVGATVSLKEIRTAGRPVKKGIHEPVSLNFFKRLSWAFEVFGETWGRQVLLLLLVLGVMLATELVLGLLPGVSVFSGHEPDDPMAALASVQSPLLVLALLLTQLVAILAGFWHQACLIRLTTAFMEEGGTTALGEIMRGGLNRLPELVTAIGLVLFPGLLVYAGLGLGLSTLLLPDSPGTLAFSLLVLSLLMLAVFIGFALVGPVSVLESRGPWAVLKRSWALSQGRRWRILGNLLLLMIGSLAVILGLQLLAGLALPAALFAGLGSDTGGLLGLAGVVITMLVFMGLYILTLFLFNFVLTSFYFEARVCSEAWAPAWEVVPDPSWPASDTVSKPAACRGMRAWMELLLFNLLVLALVAGGIALVGPRVLRMLPTHAGAGNGMHLSQDGNMNYGGHAQAPLPALSAGLPAGYQLRLQTDVFFENPQGSQLWINASLRHDGRIPEGVNSAGLLTVRINSVDGVAGVEIYDANDPLESGFHSRPVLSRREEGELTGIRSVQLLAGVTREQVLRLRGEVILNLPEGIWTEDFDAREVGLSRELREGLSVSLTQLSGTEAGLELHGSDARKHLAGVLGITAGGESLAPSIRSSSSAGARLTENLQFDRPIQGVELLLAEGFTASRHPFTMGPEEVLLLGN